MKVTDEHNTRVANLIFADIYPHYVNKVEKKGRTKEELHQVIHWLTGYGDQDLQKIIDDKVTFKIFFENAKLHPNAHLIRGVICGYRIEEIDNTLTRQCRYLDKLIEELARGRKIRINSCLVLSKLLLFQQSISWV